MFGKLIRQREARLHYAGRLTKDNLSFVDIKESPYKGGETASTPITGSAPLADLSRPQGYQIPQICTCTTLTENMYPPLS